MKITLIKNTRIQFEFDSNEQREQLSKLVSYEVPGARFSPSYQSKLWDGTKCFLSETDTLSLGLFKSLFPKHNLVYNKNYANISFDDIRLYNNLKIERRQYQLDAINTILKNKIGLVAAIMGAGKTLIAAATCSYHLSLNPKNKILFVVYDKNILNQTITNFKKYGLYVSQYGDNVKDLSGDIVVATIQSLNNIIKPAQVLKNITFCFVDEAHHSKSKTSKHIITRLPNCEYFIGLTATPYEEKTLETAELMSVLGPVIYRYGFEQGVLDNNIVPVKAFFLDMASNFDIKEQVFHRRNYKFIWDTVIKNNLNRNTMIGQILNTLTDILNTNQLVLVDRVEHGAELVNTFSTFKKLDAITMYGDDDILMRNIKRKAISADNNTVNTLISTVCKEGTDFNVSPVVALNASGRKNFISLIQFLGRIVRKNDKFKNFRAYIDFIDNEHPMLYAHSLERIEACKKFGVQVEVCNSPQELLVSIIKYFKECNVNDR